MSQTGNIIVWFITVTGLCLQSPVTYGQNVSDGGYSIHPPTLSVPGGQPGEFRRSVMQFENWTLLCDENRPIRQVVCNVTQSVEDSDGNVVFSWSLAATEDGKPFLLLRALPIADKSVPIRLTFRGSKQVVNIAYVDCDGHVCLAQSPVGPILGEQIDKDNIAGVSYHLEDGRTLSFELPFKGLKEAVASLQQ